MAKGTISPIFNQPDITGFTFMQAGAKYPPIEAEWQKKGHSFQEARAHKGNIGVMAGNDFVGLHYWKDERSSSSQSGIISGSGGSNYAL